MMQTAGTSMFQSGQCFLRIFSLSFILFTFFVSFHSFAQETGNASRKWYTHWNGKRINPSDPKLLRPSVHVAEDSGDVTWELVSEYDGGPSTSKDGVPGFTRIPQTNKLYFSKLFENGTKVKLEKIMAVSYSHYYGVVEANDSEKVIYWVDGAHLKRSGN